MKKTLIFAFVLATLFIFGCKKDNSSTNSNPNTNPVQTSTLIGSWTMYEQKQTNLTGSTTYYDSHSTYPWKYTTDSVLYGDQWGGHTSDAIQQYSTGYYTLKFPSVTKTVYVENISGGYQIYQTDSANSTKTIWYLRK